VNHPAERQGSAQEKFRNYTPEVVLRLIEKDALAVLIAYPERGWWIFGNGSPEFLAGHAIGDIRWTVSDVPECSLSQPDKRRTIDCCRHGDVAAVWQSQLNPETASPRQRLPAFGRFFGIEKGLETFAVFNRHSE
jgi:hypothetical protein